MKKQIKNYKSLDERYAYYVKRVEFLTTLKAKWPNVENSGAIELEQLIADLDYAIKRMNALDIEIFNRNVRNYIKNLRKPQ